jgi:lysozyme
MRRFLPLLAVLLVAGCGHAPPKATTPSRTTLTVEPRVTPGLPPESAVTPEGARRAAPPVGLAPAGGAPKHISVAGLHLIEGFEGFGGCPYWDPYGRVWTRGYGETEGIRAGSACISRAQGQVNLKRIVESRYEWALRELGVNLNQHEWDADCSFVWNLGAGIFTGTLIGSEMRRGDFQAAAASMLQYDHAGGVVLPGLRTRRQAEARLFLTPVKSAPTKAQRHAELLSLYRYRKRLREVLRSHGCPAYRVAGPKCRAWRSHGAQTNRQIRALHREGMR